MHLAFLTSLLPESEPRSGFAIANRAVVDGLRALGHQVDVIGARSPDAETADAGGGGETVELGTLALENAHASAAQRARWAVGALARGLPVASSKLRTLPHDAVRSVRRREHAALVVNSYQMAAAFPQLLDRPYVYLAHNAEADTAKANAAEGPLHRRLLYRHNARVLRKLERGLIQGAAHLWCLSRRDRDALAVDGTPVSVLPLVLPDAAPLPDPRPKPFDAVMIGTWTWDANATGLRWFVQEVLPHLPGEIRVAVAGSVPSGVLPRDERIVPMGRVASADGFLQQGHVVPLVARGGTGVQLKTVETFQRGLASVATASAVRGMSDLPANCTVADEPLSFAAALVDAARRGREGASLRVDPTAFVARQRRRLLDGLGAGVASLDAAS